MYFECHLLDNLPNGNHIEQVIQHAILSVDPYQSIQKNFRLIGNVLEVDNQMIDLRNVGDIYVIGFGKASIPMAEAVESVLGDRITKGAIISKQMIDNNLRKITCMKGDHPVPSKNSIASTKKIIDLVGDLKPDDLVICLISGGGSALLTFPKKEIGLEGMQYFTDFLIKSGASIQEINSVRKCIDHVKGGGLANLIQPAQFVSIILSDVIGDSLDMIASGPTVNDPKKYEKGIRIIEKFQKNHPEFEKLIIFLNNEMKKDQRDDAKRNCFKISSQSNLIVGSLAIALKAAEISAKNLGYQTKIISDHVNGEARDVGKKMGRILIKSAKRKKINDPPICLLAGGETTVTVTGKGKGGRNQELALGAAIEMDGCKNCIFVSLATDGEDSTTDAAGAIVTGNTIKDGLSNNLDPEMYLHDNNSYHYFKQSGGLIKTGPTGTNVNDLMLMFTL